ncbi:GldG family protein [Patescibacteria group bacterium]
MEIKRKTKQGINVVYAIAIMVGILFLLNYISSNIFLRFDITQNKDYTVSDVSKIVLKNLDDIVNVKVFFSKDVPPNLVSLKQDVRDILDEYSNYSKNKIQVSYVDPKDDEEAKTEARNLGIPELQFSNLEKDKYEVSTGYLGMAIIYGDKKEVIPVIEDTKNLEYDLTSTIKKVMLDEDLTVAFLKGHNELDKDTQLRIADQYLKTLYTVTTVDTTNGNLIPNNVDTLIIAGAKEEFTDREKYAIDQFLMRGKSLLVLQENVNVGDMLQATQNNTGLDLMFAHYGIKLNSNFILDPSCEMASFSSGYTQFFTSYPFWPKIVKTGFNEDSVIVGQLESLVFPWVSSVDLVEDKMLDKTGIILVNTTDGSWAQQEPKNLSPQQQFEQGEQKSHNLAVFVSGKFTSYFNDKDKPANSSVENADEQIQTEEPEFISETSSARIILVGDSDFITDNFLNRFRSNILFFQNAVDSLTLDEALIQIRSKGVSDRPIKEISAPVKKSIKFFNIFGMTLIVLLAGLIRYFLRKKTKFSDQI